MILNLTPLIYYEDNFLTSYECETIIEMSRDHLQRSKVFDKDNPITDARTSYQHWLSPTDSFVKKFMEKAAIKVGIHPSQSEPPQVIRYDKTQEYKPHYDTFDLEKNPELNETGGQRVLTALMYLNTPVSGGGTIFPKLSRRVDAVQGRLIIFHTCYPGTNIEHPFALHGGEPVGLGEKWAVNLWFREGKFNQKP